MKKLIQKYYREPSFKSTLNNFFSLGLFQASNYLFPLITIPYLTRVIGIEKIGIVFLAQSLITIFAVITDYGFNLTATRDIAIYRNNSTKISEIVSTVYILKAAITLFCLLLYLIVILSVQDFRDHYTLFLLSFGIVLAQVLIPTWFLQGMELMKVLVYINGISKLINLLLIFYFIRSSEDYYLVNLFYGAGGILTGLFIMGWIKVKKSITFFLPDWKRMFVYLRDSWGTFLSNFSINTYINANILVLKAFADPVSVGYYAIGEKILYVVRSILVVFFQAIFPQASQQSKISHEAFKKVIFNFFPLFLLGIAGLSVIIYLYSSEVFRLVSGTSTPQATQLLNILIFIPIIVALNMPAFQALLIYNLKNSYSAIFLIAAPLSIGLNLVGAYYFGATGTAWALLFTEIFITAGLIFTLEYKFPKYSVYGLFPQKAL